MIPTPGEARTALFVYGTLKRGASNHGLMAGQQFLGSARTVPGFVLYDLGGYPGMVQVPGASGFVTGEVWLVSSACLAALDRFEGIGEGLYRREPVMMVTPYDHLAVDSYLFAQSVAGRRQLGSSWPG